MRSEPTLLVKARYFSSVALLYLATLLFVGFAFNPYNLFYQPALSAQFRYEIAPAPTTVAVADAPKVEPITGMPSRVVIPSIGTDLEVLPGAYDAATGTWTLSDYSAHFALPSVQPNNIEGGTYIYGHNNWRTFGKLTKLQPGALVELHTENGHIFVYRYDAVENIEPDNVAVFQYQGPPRLSIQTCAGWLNTLRGIFYFSLVSVDGTNV